MSEYDPTSACNLTYQQVIENRVVILAKYAKPVTYVPHSKANIENYRYISLCSVAAKCLLQKYSLRKIVSNVSIFA